MPANGPAVGLFAVCAIVYVPTILSTSKPTAASSAPLHATRRGTSTAGSRTSTHQKMIMSPTTASAMPSTFSSSVAPGRSSSPIAAQDLIGERRADHGQRRATPRCPGPARRARAGSARLADEEVALRRRRGPTPRRSPLRRLPIQPSPVSSTPTRPMMPTPVRRVDRRARSTSCSVVPNSPGTLLAEVVEQALLRRRVRVQDEARDRRPPSSSSGNSARKLKYVIAAA